MKKYVKEYAGHQVPEGAAHYLDGNRFFYNADKTMCFDARRPQKGWIKTTFHGVASKAAELPEEPMPSKAEWNGEGLPPVGTLCTISADGFEYLFSASSNELSSITENTELVVVGHCTRHDNGAKCVTLMATDSTAARGFTTVNPDFIAPIKTQQEKDREAFVERVKQLLPKSDTDDLILSGKLFDLGFTAPKEGDNDK
jgi:hypothetical protein